jgi:hypothetical protein
MRYSTDGEFALANKNDDIMLKFLGKFDLTEKERRKFLANRSGLLKVAQNSVIKVKPKFTQSPTLIMQRGETISETFNRVAPNGVVKFGDIELKATQDYNASDGVKSLVRVDKDTLKVIDLHASINQASRSCGGVVTAGKLRTALYSGKIDIQGYYWIMVERMKECTLCEVWMKIEDRYKSSNGTNRDAYSSYCKDCDHSRRDR